MKKFSLKEKFIAKMIYRIFLSLFFSSIFGLAHTQIIAIKAGKIIDPLAGNVVMNQIILVEER